MSKYNPNLQPEKRTCELCNGTGEITVVIIKESIRKSPIDLGNTSASCPLCNGKGFLAIVKREIINE